MEWAFGDVALQGICRQGEDGLSLELRPADGPAWGPVPLASLEVYCKAEFRVETVRSLIVDLVEELDGGLHVIFRAPKHFLRIGLWLRVRDGELEVKLSMAEVYEDRPHTHRLFTVLVAPGLLRAGPGRKMLLPLSSGALCDPATKPRLADRFMIYGEQSRWELLPMLPICAVGGGDGGLMSLATESAGEMECHVATDGEGGGSVGLAMTLRQFWPDPVEPAARSLRLVPIRPGEDLLHTSAARLRRHVMEDLGKKPLKERAEDSPVVDYQLSAYTMKLFYGIEHCGIMMEGREQKSPITFQNVMTFAEAEHCLRRLHEAGLQKVLCQSVGWNPRGHDGLWPSRFPIEERLGGEDGFRRLNQLGRSLGYHMVVHDNQKAVYKKSPDFIADRVIHDQWGQMMGLGEWGGGVTFVLSNAVPEDEIRSGMQRVKSLGLHGVAYLDGMGNPLYRDYHPAHPMTRSDYARNICRLIEIARDVYGACGTECGFMYCVIPADSMCTHGEAWHLDLCWEDWPATHLVDQVVPLWPLALHGLITTENRGTDWSQTMKCVLMGEHTRDEWSARPGVMPVLTDERIAALRARYDICVEQFGHLQRDALTHWSQPAEEVLQTRFADGTEVTADFSEGRLTVNGTVVEQPQALQNTIDSNEGTNHE